MDKTNVAAMIQKRQEKFVETRTIIESEVNKFLESLQKQNPEIRQQVGITDGVTCRSLLPELWAENFRPEVYAGQLQQLKGYISQVQAICDNINAEALRCLS